MEVMYKAIPFSPVTTLTESIGDGDTIIPVANVGAFPEAPNIAVIGGANEESETILYAAKTSNALSGCTRGVEGTAKSWNRGETISRNYTAKDHDSFVENIKELSNKTIKSAQINEAGNLVLTLQDNSTLDAGNAKGDKGDKGNMGEQGPSGENGGYYTPTVSDTGDLTWAASKAGMPSVAGANIKGPKGDQGDPGDTGPQGETGPAGAAATINGVNALTLEATGGLTGSQSGSTYTISGNGLKPLLRTATLTTSGWSSNSQTVTVSGVVADTSAQLITVSPADKASATAWGEAGVFCSAQGANSLTFVCDSTPSANISVNISIQEAQT